MTLSIIIYICRIISLILIHAGLIIGSICTLFILREFYYHSKFRTPLNVLIVTIFITDCIRALICSPLDSYILVQTWDVAIVRCQENVELIEVSLIISNFCRSTMSIRSCFLVIQSLGFIAIACERLRTIVRRNGNLILNHNHQRSQSDLVRFKYTIIWTCISLLTGISAGIFQAITYSTSYTCYAQSNTSSRFAVIIRLGFILCSVFISGIIYRKIFLIVRKYQQNVVKPMINTIHNLTPQQKPTSIDPYRKDFRLAKNTFILFVSFFLCRIPLVILIILSLTMQEQSKTTKCYMEEFLNFSYQLTFIATITDPIAYILNQPILKRKFHRFIPFCCMHRIVRPIAH